MNPKVSILIPCYNAEKWIAQSIQSALDQTYDNKEVIVVDDGSKDDSFEIIKSFEGKIHFESGPNRGGNIARNRLLQLSSGEWLQYLDADDYLLPDKIYNQANAIDNEVDVIFSQCLVEYLGDGTRRIELGVIPPPFDLYVIFARWRMPQTGSTLWRKSALVDVGCWKDTQPVCQEHELYLRLLMAGKKFKFVPKAESVYRQWGEITLWKKNQSFTRLHKLIIVNRLEKHLIDSHQMNGMRQEAINVARFEIARNEWTINRSRANAIIKKMVSHQGRFFPGWSKGTPARYNFFYVFVGFDLAERIARAVRRQTFN